MCDYLIVGTGLTGAVCAQQLSKAGKKVFMIDKRHHLAGNCYTEAFGGINIHKYGPHIFHTNSKHIWDYVNRYAEFVQYNHKVKVNYRGDIYTIPVNLSTFSEFFGGDVNPTNMRTTFELFTSSAKKQSEDNLEAYILAKIPKTIYEALIKGYTEKQWNKSCNELPSSIIKRLPIRYNFDDNYFTDIYQGIPKEGYTKLVENIIGDKDISLWLDTNFLDDRSYYLSNYDKIIYTGCIDEFFGYDLGRLEYRSLRFEEYKLPIEDYQGIAQMNFSDKDIPYTRITEHKHFQPYNKTTYTVITYEYPEDFDKTNEPYYPIRDEVNTRLYNNYVELAKKYCPNVIFCGRLGSYQYYDMHQAIAQAFRIADRELQ